MSYDIKGIQIAIYSYIIEIFQQLMYYGIKSIYIIIKISIQR